ncbi:MFS transporter [Sphingomonas sp. BIUV-7]|uniref:MFS transporter n=1 Tax=Sphingomonas natans TaxID=3063330 RepID=A0ABT8Y8P8_9SPHN|nr:MFS transporter [Sphingomonas sp. BIUV-7]MDO6414707.1 MFS transporter [Sphingomonas sp. BIUV-7]
MSLFSIGPQCQTAPDGQGANAAGPDRASQKAVLHSPEGDDVLRRPHSDDTKGRDREEFVADMKPHIPLYRKIGYAFGDYGCNLYWQSISFFLLFFYTDIVGIPIGIAGLIYMVASIFDGCIDPIAGALLDRGRTRFGRYRHWLLIGAVPLAASFALLYWKPVSQGYTMLTILLVAHLLFRVCYTVVAVPLASLSARMTDSSTERTTLASLRMLFGAGATATVGFVTQPLGAAIGHGDQARGIFLVALILGLVATLALVIAFLSTREPPVNDHALARIPLRSYVDSVRLNPAFIALAFGLLFATLSTTSLNKSLLYYFKYVVHDEGSARYALSSGALISLILAPGWAILGRRAGKRVMWLTAVTCGLAGLICFLIIRPTGPLTATAFFMWMQIVTVGIQVSYWGTLPDTVEYGEWRSGVRHESFLFGLFMFVQKAGFGLAVAIYGACLSAIGFHANAMMASGTLWAIGLVMAGLSAFGLIGSGVAAYLSPLRLGVHERVVGNLAEAARTDGAVA